MNPNDRMDIIRRMRERSGDETLFQNLARFLSSGELRSFCDFCGFGLPDDESEDDESEDDDYEDLEPDPDEEE